MNSPDSISFTQFIKIDRRNSDAVYLQLVYQLIHAIQRGILQTGQKIPGSRVLAAELGVHRKTILAALEELQAQGWLEIRPKIGTFIRRSETTEHTNRSFQRVSDSAGFHFRKSFVLDTEKYEKTYPFRFSPGESDYRIIDTNELARFYSTVLKRKNSIKKLPEYASQGNLFFKKQLSSYINLTRNFHIGHRNLLTAQSKEVILYILTQLLVQRGEVILVSALSYHFSNMVFRQAGAVLKTVPVDENGMQVDYIRTHYKKGELRAVYVHPQDQYPTTVRLSEERRKKLVQLAEEYDFLMIEDDSNFELTYKKHTALSLLQQDAAARVIYLSSFGQFLTPGFQANFMIAPEDLVAEAHKYLAIFGTTDVIKEQALGEMIYEGDIHRYRRKALRLYQERRDHFAGALQASFSKDIRFRLPECGWAIWVEFSKQFSLQMLVKNCQAEGLFIPRICLYQNQQIVALRLGFGHLNEQEMDEAVRLLRKGYETVVNGAKQQDG